MTDTEKILEQMSLPGGDMLYRYEDALVLAFAGQRRTLSTGPDNGGYREDLRYAFNFDERIGKDDPCELRADTYEEHLDLIAREDLELDPALCTGLTTAAHMCNRSVRALTYEDFTVTAIVTGGIAQNGGRAGDPAFWHETDGAAKEAHAGTINILLHISADLSPGALARALVMCTEAKTAAIQELLAPSRYSNGIATGSGTDGTVVICNAESEVLLTNAGKHCKLGEYIGRTVKEAVKEALALQAGTTPAAQHDVICRMDRFGVTDSALWEAFSAQEDAVSRERFDAAFSKLRREETLVTRTSLLAHLLDQLEWGLLSAGEVRREAARIFAGLAFSAEARLLEEEPDGQDKEALIRRICALYAQGLVHRIGELLRAGED